MSRCQILVVVFGVLGAFSAFARDVNIVLTDVQTTLTLTNPSTVTVSYDITCQKPDGSGVVYTATTQTLAPNARAIHTPSSPDSGKCASNANPISTLTDAGGKNFYFCAGTVNYANANTACGTGNSFCFPDVSFGVSACGCGTFWLKNGGDEQFQPSCGTYAAVTGGNQIAIGNFATGFAKKSSTTSPCSYFYYAASVADTTTMGAVCCSAPVVASVCKITINTTDPAAHLASPTFLGGAAF